MNSKEGMSDHYTALVCVCVCVKQHEGFKFKCMSHALLLTVSSAPAKQQLTKLQSSTPCALTWAVVPLKCCPTCSHPTGCVQQL